MSIFRHLLWSVFKAWKVWLYGIQKIEVFLSMIFKDWKVWLNGIQKIEELNSIIFKAWKVWLYGIQKIEEFNSMVFTTWKLWFYGIQKIEEFKSMVFKAWRGQNLLMRTLVVSLDMKIKVVQHVERERMRKSVSVPGSQLYFLETWIVKECSWPCKIQTQ